MTALVVREQAAITRFPFKFDFRRILANELDQFFRDLSLMFARTPNAEALLFKWMTRTIVRFPMEQDWRNEGGYSRIPLADYLEAAHQFGEQLREIGFRRDNSFEKAAFVALKFGGNTRSIEQDFGVSDLGRRMRRLQLAEHFGWSMREMDTMTLDELDDAYDYLSAVRKATKPRGVITGS